MPVTSSSFVIGGLQADGRRKIRETHVLSAGDPVHVTYLAAAHLQQTDFESILTARASQINESLANNEFEVLVGAP